MFEENFERWKNLEKPQQFWFITSNSHSTLVFWYSTWKKKLELYVRLLVLKGPRMYSLFSCSRSIFIQLPNPIHCKENKMRRKYFFFPTILCNGLEKHFLILLFNLSLIFIASYSFPQPITTIKFEYSSTYSLHVLLESFLVSYFFLLQIFVTTF